MSDLNRVCLVGRLGRDPELRFLPSNTAVCSFSIAVGEKWKGKDGQVNERTNWIDCEAFAGLGETINKYLRKGSQVAIEGRLRMDEWQDKDGKKRTKLKVVIDGFTFCGGRQDGQGQSRPQEQRQTAPATATAGDEHQTVPGDDIPF